jgi:putative phosphoserine phosphatase/1-acylglycerol-3-phosphate O-acyltransferase
MRAADYLFINRSNPGDAREKLRQAGVEIKSGGRSVIMFPEGTRYPSGHLGPFKSGAFHLASAAEVALVPVGLTRTGELMHRKSLLCYSGNVDIHIGPLIETSHWIGREQELRDFIRGEVRRLAGNSAAKDSISA